MADTIPTTIELNARDRTKPAFASVAKNVQKANVQTKALNNTYRNLSGTVLRATTVLVTFTVAAAAIGSSIGAARQFGKSMAEVATLIDDAETSLTAYKDVVEDLVKTYGGQFLTTTKALYDTISAGNGTVAEASAILTAANVAAIAGVSDIATATDALTTIINSYGLSASDATGVSDILFNTIKAGKTTMTELAPVLGQVTATASAMGVSFGEVGAVLATATAKGIRTSQAVTGLKAVLSNIIKPTKDAEDMMARLGVEFSSAALQAKGFAPFFRDILVAAEEKGVPAGRAMEAFFGSVEALNTVLALTAGNAEAFEKNLIGVANTTGSTAEAFTKMTKTFDFQWNAFVGKIKVGAKGVGMTLTDALIKPLIFINENFELWSFSVAHIFAQVQDVVIDLVRGVTNQFMKLGDIFDWVFKSFIKPIKEAFDWLYEEVIDSSSVPDLVNGITFWFDKLKDVVKDIFNFFFEPLETAFSVLAFLAGKALQAIDLRLSSLGNTSLPNFRSWFDSWLGPAEEAKETLDSITGIFLGALTLGVIRTFFGISLIKLAWAAYDKLVGKVRGYSGALAANRKLAFEAQQANIKMLKDQQKFMKSQAEFGGQFGKVLQGIVDSGGSRSFLRRFFGGSDEWVLAKAKAQDAVDGAKKSIRGLSIDSKGVGKQSFLSRILVGKLNTEQISRQVNDAKETIKKASADLAAQDGRRGFFSYLNNAVSTFIGKTKFAGNAIETMGSKFVSLGTKLRSVGLNLGISAALTQAGIKTNGLINAIGRISPAASKVADKIQFAFANASIKMGRGIIKVGGIYQRLGQRAQKALDGIRLQARATRLAIASSTAGRGLMWTAIMGKNTVVGLTRLSGKILGGIAKTSRGVRAGITGGLMGFMMFGSDISAALGAAQATEATGSFFENIKGQMGAAVDAIPDTSLAMLAMFGPIGAVIGIAALAFKHWDKIKEVFNKFLDWIVQQDWADILVKSLKFASEGILKLGVWLAEMTWEGMKLVGGLFVDLGAWIWEKIVSAFSFDTMGDSLLSSLEGIGQRIIDLFLEWNPISLWFKGASSLASFFGFEEVEQQLDSMRQRGQSLAQGVISDIGDGDPNEGSNLTSRRYAEGGPIMGPGTGTSDSIAARLSDGEFVVNAASTKKFWPVLEAINKDADVAKAMSALGTVDLKKFLVDLQQVELPPGFANGGHIAGPGTGTSDSIPAMLSNGEFVVNAESTKKFWPVLEAINKDEHVGQAIGALGSVDLKKFLEDLKTQGNLPKFAKGGLAGSLRGGTQLASIFEKNNDVDQSKKQFIATFGAVDFEDAKTFLNQLFGLKLSKADIAGMDPLLLRRITESMTKLEASTSTAIRDLEAWTPENREMSKALQVSTNQTAEWQSELVQLIEPLVAAGTETAKYTKAISDAGEKLTSFTKGWREAIVDWQAGLSDLNIKGANAARMFIGGIEGVIDALIEGGSIRDSLRNTVVGAAKETAKDTLLTSVSGLLPNLKDAGEGASNVFEATGNVLFNATGKVTVQGLNLPSIPGTVPGPHSNGIFGALSGLTSNQGVTGGGLPVPLDFLGGFAKGGIPPVNQVSLVGEKGPELFVPSQKGRIIPNNMLKQDNSSVNINQTLNITEAMDPQAFQKELVRNNQVVVGMVQQSYERRGRRGGPNG